MITCPMCGTALAPYGGRGRRAVFCSTACRKRAWQLRQTRDRLTQELTSINYELVAVDMATIRGDLT